MCVCRIYFTGNESHCGFFLSVFSVSEFTKSKRVPLQGSNFKSNLHSVRPYLKLSIFQGQKRDFFLWVAGHCSWNLNLRGSCQEIMSTKRFCVCVAAFWSGTIQTQLPELQNSPIDSPTDWTGFCSRRSQTCRLTLSVWLLSVLVPSPLYLTVLSVLFIQSE